MQSDEGGVTWSMNGARKGDLDLCLSFISPQVRGHASSAQQDYRRPKGIYTKCPLCSYVQLCPYM